MAMLCEGYAMFRVNSPEFGLCKLEVSDKCGLRVMRLISEDSKTEYAIGEDSDEDIVDCKLYEDEDYYYLTSYLQPPIKTVRVEKCSMESI